MAESGIDPAPPAFDDVLEAVEQRAPAWLGLDGPARASLTHADERPQATLLRIRVDTPAAVTPIVAKLPKAVARRERATNLVEPVADPRRKSRLEHDALVAVADHLRSLGDPRFGWVTVYDHLPDRGVLILSQVEGPTLDHVLRTPPTSSYPSDARDTLLGNLGGWLAEFHRVETVHMEPRGGSPEMLRGDLHRLREMLGRCGRADRLPRQLPSVVDEVVPAVLPAQLATGLGHGDLAPRNVLVGEDHSVTIIDSLGRFRVPVHEDPAYFLVELATGSTRFARRRRLPASGREVARLRSAFLAGYPLADDATLWAFELRALLDKWRSLADRGPGVRSAHRVKGLADSARERVLARHVATLCERLVSSC